jgi:hypothetical protein
LHSKISDHRRELSVAVMRDHVLPKLQTR